MSNLAGWHRGERIARHKLGLDKIPAIADAFQWISGDMPDQHTTFYTTRLQFLPICTLDGLGRPWNSLLVGKDGQPGFVKHPRYNTLAIKASLSDGDPLLRNAKEFEHVEDMYIAGVGVELSTGRRNKFAGLITNLRLIDCEADLELVANEAIGNCPKYIAIRELEPSLGSHPIIQNDQPMLSATEQLPPAAISLITSSDLVFFGTSYAAREDERSRYPSHLGLNHRGGPPGFIRVKPSDGRTIVVPDFSGNRLMSTLGNVEATPLASLTFVSFETGDILYVTGDARNLYGEDSQKVMPFQNTLTEVYVTGFTYVQQGFPLRQISERETQFSPYNPPVRLLAEENQTSRLFTSQQLPELLLTRITLHSTTIATFDWEVSTSVHIDPGQATILDFKSLLGSRQYQHMSPMKPSLVNDDFIRTWTVSSASEANDGSTRTFSLTMREKSGGVVTGALFNLARKLAEKKPEILTDVRSLHLKVHLVGVTGDFVLPPIADPTVPPPSHLLWIAGGIGATPFLAMIRRLSVSKTPFYWGITLVLSARDPDVMLALFEEAFKGIETLPNLSIHLYSTSPSSFNPRMQVTKHKRRIGEADLKDLMRNLDDVEAFLCGPDSFVRSMHTYLSSLKVVKRVHQEGFAY